ncbi:unnamed protein product [Ascophyllum nodosum]
MLNHSLRRCPRVKFLREKLENLGCEMPQESFSCQPCEGMEISGGFVPPTTKDTRAQVVLCDDKEVTQTMVDHTMAHELVHAYDQCRVKLDRSNCLHVACTEIRASNTSGECSFNMEFLRGNWRWGGQQKECVKRRAELSLKATPGLESTWSRHSHHATTTRSRTTRIPCKDARVRLRLGKGALGRLRRKTCLYRKGRNSYQHS